MSFVNAIAKRFGFLPESQVRAAINGFQAAALSRLTNDWTTSTLSADAQTRNDLKKLIPRCRDLRDNYDYAKKFVSMAKNNVIGAGVHFKNKAKDPDRVEGGRLIPGRMDTYANKVIEDAKYEWSKKENCTVTRDTSFYDVEKIVLESCITDGGVIVRMVRGFDNPFRFALQLFDIDFVDFELNVPRQTDAGNEIKMGVEFNAWGERVNYYLLARNPNDSYYGLQNYGPRHVILPARDVIHPFIKYRPRQTHGIPWMVTPAERMKMLKGYEEAELVASRVAAAKMGFFQTTGEAEYKGDPDGLGNKYMDAEPGAFEQIPQGLELAKWDPQHPNSSYAAVVKAWLRGAAAGLNVSYHTLANDMEAVNFASGMIGLGEERDAWRCIQDWEIEEFEEPIHTNWLEAAILTKAVPLPMSKFKKFNAPCFSGRRWEFVNPSVEVTAIKEMLALRLTSVTRELAKKNIDRDELFQEIEEERKEMERRGIMPEEVLESLAAVEQAQAQAEAASQPQPQPAA